VPSDYQPSPETLDKLRELTLYVAWLRRDDPHFGATLLNKCLYYADFDSYFHTGFPITGVEYMKEKFGPVPRNFSELKADMQKKGEVALRTETYGEMAVERMIPVREANLALFTGPEIALVNAVVDKLSQSTATAVSRMSHGHIWAILEMHETIPYNAAFISDAPPTARDYELARQIAKKKGWDGDS
jgi:hypothetical protein